MSDKPTRKSKEDNLISGTIAICRDNKQKFIVINKLQSFLESLHSHAMNENDVVLILTMCKEHLQKSHSIICDNLPKVNRGAKVIIAALSRINRNSTHVE